MLCDDDDDDDGGGGGCGSCRGVASTAAAVSVGLRRGSCSLEVMQGLRAKCHARSLSSQQNVVVMTETLQPTANTPTMETAGDTAASELPPDILQSCLYLSIYLLVTVASKGTPGDAKCVTEIPGGDKKRKLRGGHVKYVTTRPPSPPSLMFQFLKSS